MVTRGQRSIRGGTATKSNLTQSAPKRERISSTTLESSLALDCKKGEAEGGDRERKMDAYKGRKFYRRFFRSSRRETDTSPSGTRGKRKSEKSTSPENFTAIEVPLI